MDGWVDGKAGLRIAYSNQNFPSFAHAWKQYSEAKREYKDHFELFLANSSIIELNLKGEQ